MALTESERKTLLAAGRVTGRRPKSGHVPVGAAMFQLVLEELRTSGGTVAEAAERLAPELRKTAGNIGQAFYREARRDAEHRRLAAPFITPNTGRGRGRPGPRVPGSSTSRPRSPSPRRNGHVADESLAQHALRVYRTALSERERVEEERQALLSELDARLVEADAVAAKARAVLVALDVEIPDTEGAPSATSDS